MFPRARAKGSCCVRLPPGPSCLSRGGCGRVAGELPSQLRPQNRPIENLHFPRENQGFWEVEGVPNAPGPGSGILSFIIYPSLLSAGPGPVFYLSSYTHHSHIGGPGPGPGPVFYLSSPYTHHSYRRYFIFHHHIPITPIGRYFIFHHYIPITPL